MENVHPDHEFKFNNGKSAKNIWELQKKILSMPDDEYASHVSAEKNDFAEWVEYAVKDPELADKLRNSTSKETTAEIINTKINQLKVELGKSHVVGDFELIKDFLIGLIIGLIIGVLFGHFVL